MKKKFWTSDKLFGLVAMFISVITLIIFVKQTNIMEKQSRLSAMPYLMIETSEIGSKNIYSFQLVNHGVGPAIIDSTILFYKGKTYNLEFKDFLRANIKSMDSIPILNNASINRGLAIPADGVRNILQIGGNKEDYDAFFQVLEELYSNDFDFEIRYRSIYDDKWRITSKKEIPEKLN
ncbi:hypothetical protein [Allomuricauda sp. R78024]|uniref:hypothetical protein n=1 Tax=Allomuricauda sp. R78024 TaxID=3093867 RepID=UPI0037C5BEB6